MKITQRTTRLALYFNLLYIIASGLMLGLGINKVQVSQTAYFLMMLVTQAAYVVVLLYLSSVLKIWGTRPAAIGVTMFIAGIILSFILSNLLPGFGVPAEVNLTIMSLFGLLFIGIVLYMVVTAFGIKSEIKGPYLAFALSILFTQLLITFLPVIYTLFVHERNMNTNFFAYSNLIYLLPPLLVFFILQRVPALLAKQQSPVDKNHLSNYKF